MGIDHQANRRALLEVEQVLLQQPAVDYGVEPAVVDDVVDVAVDVVVHPARGDIAQEAIVFALMRCGFAHGSSLLLHAAHTNFRFLFGAGHTLVGGVPYD
ncbi:hypothetical protein D3C80_1669000 [compost metagenome]